MAKRRTYWEDTASPPLFESLAGDIAVDVAIVGGGIVGVSAARSLKDRGFKVAVVEARRVGRGVSGKATAKVSSQHGIFYTRLKKKFGKEAAQLYADAQETGLRTIDETVRRFGLDADFERAPAFVYTREERQVSAIQDEVELARELGLPASLTKDTGLPYEVLAAMRWDDQGQFHPIKYVAGLAATIPGDGCHVFENSRVTDWQPDRVATAHGTVNARHVLMATNLPLGTIGGYFAMNYPMAEPVLAAPISNALPGYYINAEQPGHSIRLHQHQGHTWAVCAGPHSKPGHTDDLNKKFADLEQWLTENFDVGPIQYRWINEDYSPMDDAPFIGWSSDDEKDHYLVATGFAAWGFTNGAAAGTLIADLVQGRDNPWVKLFDATRIKPIAGGPKLAKENVKVAGELVTGLFSPKPSSAEDLNADEGAVLKTSDGDVAVYRYESGHVHTVTAVCSHMGCIVGWNPTDRTWDCPCHGSRFTFTGDVIAGPAVAPLMKMPFDADAKEKR